MRFYKNAVKAALILHKFQFSLWDSDEKEVLEKDMSIGFNSLCEIRSSQGHSNPAVSAYVSILFVRFLTPIAMSVGAELVSILFVRFT